VTVLIGQGGGGKTVMVNKLLVAAIAQGMRGFIIDRSTISTGDGQARVQGHYDPLLSLVPGSAKVHVGTGSRDVISPWDVADPAQVAGAKLEFLLAFHALLIGNTAATGDERRLSADEEGPLTTGIAAVYARCARTAERPRETLLVQELDALAETGEQPRQRRRDDPLAHRAPHPIRGGWAAGAHRGPRNDGRARSTADAV
jgi:type IV secretory pathway VirB4 component